MAEVSIPIGNGLTMSVKCDCVEGAAAIERLIKDAERYHYLRSQAVYEGSSDWTIEVWGRYASIEEAIDAAIRESKRD